MIIPWCLPRRFLTLTCVLSAASLGCDDQSTNPSDEYLNPDKPNANSRILSEAMIGDPTKSSSIYSLDVDAAGQYWFRGQVDDRAGVGILNPSGDIVRFESTTYSARGLHCLSPAAPAPGATVVVGAHDVDGDGNSDRGYASLFSQSGSLTDQLLFASDSSGFWLSDVAPVTDSTLIVVGAERRKGTNCPYLALLAITPEQRLLRRADVTLISHPGRRLGRVVVFPTQPGATELFVCALSGEGAGPGLTVRIEGIRAALPSLDPVGLEWSREIVGQNGPSVVLVKLDRVGDNIFVVGQADDNRKQPPSSGGYWESGLAASYSRNGDLRWLTIVSVSQTSDAFNDIRATADVLYAVGDCASYLHRTTPDQHLGYGLISKINPTNGQVLESMILGQDRFSSGFYGAVEADNVLTCVGWTDAETTGGPQRGWFSRIHVGASAPPLAATAFQPLTSQAQIEERVRDRRSMQ